MSGSSEEGEPDVKVDAFSRAVQKQDKQTLERLLRKREKHPVSLPADDRNWTALHLAASDSKYEECLELILRYRGTALYLDTQTADGETPLFIACQNGCEKNVLSLLHKGCDVDKSSLRGNTALHIAASKGYTKIVEYLCDYSVNVEVGNDGGYRPLHQAAIKGHLEVCRILLQKGASVRSESLRLGLIPLHLACVFNHIEVARCLVEHDPATLNFQNGDGYTPFMYAVRYFGISEIRYLLENGAKIDIFDKAGKSALHYAIGNAKVFQILLEHINVSSFESKWLDTYNNTNNIFSLLSYVVADKNVESVDLLFKSNLPRRILEMTNICFDLIYSPVTYILSQLFAKCPGDQDFVDRRMKYLDSSLELLIKHELVFDKSFKQFQERYPNRRFRFFHPFDPILCNFYSRAWPREKQLHYFKLLNTNGVTTDYCLQCYHNNTMPSLEIVDYPKYYKYLLYVTAVGNLEAVKLCLTNSAILEPDLLLTSTEATFREQVPFDMYEYLTLLKPESPTNELFHLQILPIPELLYPYFNAKERFSRCTLLQLCRTAVRRQLRGRTLEEDLKNFRRKILELPIPLTLKEYLLFKN